MRVIDKNPENMGWTTITFCTGYGWDQGNKRPCGAKLEVADKDIRARSHTDISGCSDRYYGFVCPICGCFTELPTREIPFVVQEFADKSHPYKGYY